MAIAFEERASASARAQFSAGPPPLRPRSPAWPPTAVQVGMPPTRRPKRCLRLDTRTMGPSSTIALARSPRRSGVSDGSDFLPYTKQGRIDHNGGVSVGLGRRPRTVAGAAQIEGASRLRIQHSPQSEEEREARSAPRRRLYWAGQEGFEGFMPLTRWSEGVPRRRGRERSGAAWIEALIVATPSGR
jgi:hypothetical protein